MMIDTKSVYSDLISLLQSLSEEEWQIKVDEQWTVKDIVAHLIGWNVEAAKELPKTWQTGEDPWFMNTDDYEQFNQQFVDKMRSLSGAEVLARFVEAENEFNEVINEIGEDKLRKEAEKYDWVFDEGEDSHYLEHFKQIKKAVSGQD